MKINSLDQAIQIGHDLIKEGRYVDLLGLSQQLREVAPDNHDVLNLNVLANWHSGDKALAVRDQNAMLAIEPTNLHLHKRLLSYYWEQKDFDGIAKGARIADRDSEVDGEMLGCWAHAEFALGNHSESKSLYRRLANNFPDDIRGHLFMSRPLLEMGEKGLSVRAFSKSLIPWIEGKSDAQCPHEIADTYSNMSGGYDENLLHQTFAERLTAFSLDYVSFDSNYRYLDLGCGTGKVGEQLARFGKVNIAGIDISAGMLEIAHKKNIYQKLILGDLAERIGEEESEKYDILFSSCAFYHIPNLTSVIFECARILAPGGYLFFTTDPATDDFLIAQSNDDYLRNYMRQSDVCNLINQYAHSQNYLRSISRKFMFSEFHLQILYHRGQPGFYCAYRK